MAGLLAALSKQVEQPHQGAKPRSPLGTPHLPPTGTGHPTQTRQVRTLPTNRRGGSPPCPQHGRDRTFRTAPWKTAMIRRRRPPRAPVRPAAQVPIEARKVTAPARSEPGRNRCSAPLNFEGVNRVWLQEGPIGRPRLLGNRHLRSQRLQSDPSPSLA
jgi:hypothetical protein